MQTFSEYLKNLSMQYILHTHIHIYICTHALEGHGGGKIRKSMLLFPAYIHLLLADKHMPSKLKFLLIGSKM